MPYIVKKVIKRASDGSIYKTIDCGSFENFEKLKIFVRKIDLSAKSSNIAPKFKYIQRENLEIEPTDEVYSSVLDNHLWPEYVILGADEGNEFCKRFDIELETQPALNPKILYEVPNLSDPLESLSDVCKQEQEQELDLESEVEVTNLSFTQRFLLRLSPWQKQLLSFLAHPGTWTLLGLTAITIGAIIGVFAPVLLPAAAPILGIIAAVAAGAVVLLAAPFYIYSYVQKLRVQQGKYANHIFKKGDEHSHYPRANISLLKIALINFIYWLNKHPVQRAVITIGIAAFIIALVLTIGFFTGGAGFAFMAPVFAALMAPLAASLTSAVIPTLALMIMSGLAFTLAPVNIANSFKRLIQWFTKETGIGGSGKSNDEAMDIGARVKGKSEFAQRGKGRPGVLEKGTFAGKLMREIEKFEFSTFFTKQTSEGISMPEIKTKDTSRSGSEKKNSDGTFGTRGCI